MLTTRVDNAQLEQQLVEQARAKGKTAEQFAASLLADALNQLTPLPFAVTRLDPTHHSRALQFDVAPETDNEPAFGHVDTLKFAKDLRFIPGIQLSDTLT